MHYIAHIRESDQQIQTVEQHLLEVKSLAEQYGSVIGVQHITGLAGMLHDMGKFTDKFRSYILQAVQNPDAPPRKGSVDHSTAGGRLLYHLFHTKEKGLLAEIVGNAIISHHSYLHDYISPDLELKYLYRVRDKQDIDEFDKSVQLFFESVMNERNFYDYVDRAVEELHRFRQISSTLNSEVKMMFLSKYVFSALIDADRTNTREFEENRKLLPDPIEPSNLFAKYYQKLMTELERYKQHPNAEMPIPVLRRHMSEQCDRFAEQPSGIYTLSIPTGGGKTLASLRYALKHALNTNKRRIIYILPFTTIIEQNAAEVRRILQDGEHILEHHSNVVEELEDDDEYNDGIMNVQQKLKLVKDNWDVPIIFTTLVQFLEVFFAKGSKSARRLHNLSQSILIFDEVQKVPTPCISLFNEALNFLSAYGGSSILLCTATQPALDFVKHKLNIAPDGEIIQDLDHVTEAFKRVQLVDLASNESSTNQTILDLTQQLLQEKNSILIILNTKSVVRNLYSEMKAANTDGEITLYHLSTSMCAAHRKVKLASMREDLQAGKKVICISTALIEAGVDVSFECVIRSLAGLDSIAQAAGRCNRHGEHDLQQVYIVDHTEENLKHLTEVNRGKRITRKILIDLRNQPELYGGSPLSISAMKRYFQEFYSESESELDYRIPKLGISMTSLLFASPRYNKYLEEYQNQNKARPPQFLMNSYRTAAEHFRVIDSPAKTVLVPYEDGKEIIAELNGAGRIEDLTKLMRRAQAYTVNLFEHELRRLDRSGGLESCLDGKVLVLKDGAYNDEFGMDVENESWSGELLY
ncbi:CRISPR-associated helicase Cas3' [Paenibacillus sp. JCM 10914]